jgi:hypothetical protein
VVNFDHSKNLLSMLRKLFLFIAFLFIVQFARAQEPCDIVFDLFGSNTACAGAPGFFLPPVAPFGGVYSGEGVSADGFFDTSVLLPGTYEVTYTADTAVCLGSGSATITLLSPTPFSLTGFTSVCEIGDSTVLSTLEGYELTWEGGIKSTSNLFVVSERELNTFATYTDASGCTFVLEFTVGVEDFSGVEIIAPQQTCNSQEVAIEIDNVTSVVWLIDQSVDTSITTSFTQDTILEWRVFVGACDTVLTHSIEVADSIVFDLITDTTLCPGQMGLMEVTGNALYYLLSGYGVFTDSLEFELSDNTTVLLKAFGEFECSVSSFIDYIVDDLPPLTITYPDSICESSPIEIYAAGAYEYVWLNDMTGDTLFATDQQDAQLVAEQSLDWSITGFSLYGCSLKQEVDIYVDPKPMVRIDTLTAFCLELPILLQANGALNYTWSNGFVGDTLEFEGTMDTVFSVIGATALGCVNFDTLNVTVHEVPIVTAFGENSICEGDTATVSAIGAVTYIWGGVLEGETVDLTPTLDSAISFVGYNVFGCADFSIFNINVDPAPNIEFIGPAYICNGDSASLEIITDGVFTWSDGSISAVIPVTPYDDTTYVVTSIGGNSCPRTASYSVSVYPYPQLSFNGPTSLCYGDSASVTINGADLVIWSNGLEGDSLIFLPQGSQTILIYGSSADGCTTVYPYSLTVHPLPQVQFAFSADTLCESGSGISWTASPIGGVLSGDGVVNNWFDLGAAQTGVNTVNYTVTSEFNCIAGASDELIVETCLNTDDLLSDGLRLYPNPATDNALLTWSGVATYTIMNSQGQMVTQGQFSSRLNLDLTEWSAGIYLIDVRGDQTSETVRLVKQ